jgi:hypothetical protein
MLKLLEAPSPRAALAALTLWLAATLPLSAGEKKRPPSPPVPEDTPEWVIRLADIVLAKNVGGGGDSPLARSKSRLGWEWLAKSHGLPPDGKIDRKGFRGPKELFDRLDRDGDGVLHAGDFDWSENAPFLRQQALARALFSRLNQDGDGTLSAKEWQDAFAKLAGPKGALTPEDLRKMLYPGGPPRSMTPPSRWHRLFGFFSGELGSLHEGPNPGEPAPDFTLSTPDGKAVVKLSDYRNNKPVVLIFGNFT